MIPRIACLLLVFTLSSAWAVPRLTSPTNGITLSGSSVDFRWTAGGTEIIQWHLSVGTTERGEQIFSRGFNPGTQSWRVNGVPTNGAAVFVTLFYLTKEGQQFLFHALDYRFSTPLPAPPALTTPSPGSVLSDTTVSFSWDDRGTSATQWRLQVGTTVGGTQYRDATVGASTRSVSVTGLPADGSAVWVRLSYFFINVWRHLDYQYTAKITSTTPVITTPGPGGTVSTVPFVIQWVPSQSVVDQWQILVGAAQGGNEIFDTGELASGARAATVSELPLGTTGFWIRLRYREGGVWEEKDFEYLYDPNGDAAPQIFSPPLGNEIVGSEVEFQWTQKLVNVTNWWIYVGRAVGDDSIFNQEMGTATSVVVNNLPSDGDPLYVRLFYEVDGVWNQRDALYATRRLPKMSFPAPGTLIAGPQINFEWDDNGVVGNAWAITVGRAKGGTDILESGTLVASQRELLVTLPSNLDGDVWVRLWQLPNSFTWSFADFRYQVQGPVLPALTEPTPGSSFVGGTTKRFHFAPNNTILFAYWVYVGTTVGGRDLFNSGFINSNQTFVDVDFTDEDQTISVRLWWLIDVNRWQFADYTLAVEKSSTPSGNTPGITPPSI